MDPKIIILSIIIIIIIFIAIYLFLTREKIVTTSTNKPKTKKKSKKSKKDKSKKKSGEKDKPTEDKPPVDNEPIEPEPIEIEKYDKEHKAVDRSGNLLAFPGAMGYGAYAKGGRNGTLYKVTSLSNDDDKKGTLRYGIKNIKGPVTIIFEVDGVIDCDGDDIGVKRSYITIDALTVGGKGITLINGGLSVSKGAEHVIIRGLRSRPMTTDGDAINVRNAKNVIIDHCSASWAADEVLSVNSSLSDDSVKGHPYTDLITIQNCLIYEAFGDKKQDHRFAGIYSSTDGGRISVLKNVFVSCDSRNPRLGHSLDDGYDKKNPPIIDFTNNLIYNWGDTAGYNAEESDAPVLYNFRYNLYLPGPDTEDDDIIFSEKGTNNSRGYYKGNAINFKQPSDSYDLVEFKDWDKDDIKEFKDTDEVKTPNTTIITNLQQLYQILIAGVGSKDNSYGLERDKHDRRVIEEIKNRKGSLVEDPDDYDI